MVSARPPAGAAGRFSPPPYGVLSAAGEARGPGQPARAVAQRRGAQRSALDRETGRATPRADSPPPQAAPPSSLGPRGLEGRPAPRTGAAPPGSASSRRLRPSASRWGRVSAGVAAPSTVDTNPDTASGSARPAGVDTNSTSAISANTTAPPATRAFAQITAPSIANKINAPTLCITGHPPPLAGEGRRAGRTHPTGSPALDRHHVRPSRAARAAHSAAFARAPASAASAARHTNRRLDSSKTCDHARASDSNTAANRAARSGANSSASSSSRSAASRSTASSRCSNTLLIGPPPPRPCFLFHSSAIAADSTQSPARSSSVEQLFDSFRRHDVPALAGPTRIRTAGNPFAWISR